MTPLPEVLPSAIATAAPGDGGGGGTLGGDKNALDFLGELARTLGRLNHRRRRCHWLVDTAECLALYRVLIDRNNIIINTTVAQVIN